MSSLGTHTKHTSQPASQAVRSKAGALERAKNGVKYPIFTFIASHRRMKSQSTLIIIPNTYIIVLI